MFLNYKLRQKVESGFLHSGYKKTKLYSFATLKMTTQFNIIKDFFPSRQVAQIIEIDAVDWITSASQQMELYNPRF